MREPYGAAHRIQPAPLSRMPANLLKSTLHNVGVVIVGLGVAYLGRMVDSLFGFSAFVSPLAKAGGLLLLGLGFLLRLWATFHFYVHNMRVISLEPQNTLITSGPYRFSRNPLYLGGNVFIFFGAALLLGSPTALGVTALHIPLMDRFIRREERQLERNFGDEWRSYKGRVRRWF
jgi:protein-S-isoprenylcysteine O-methyltransferase Ste14